MQQLKRNTKQSIFTFLAIILAIIISISTLAKTEIYFFVKIPKKILKKNYIL